MSWRRIALAAAALFAIGPMRIALAVLPGFTAPATPPGITVQPEVKMAPMQMGAPSPAPSFFTDANGMALYVLNGDTTRGRSECAGECATKWTPFIAPENAAAVGDWTVIARADGASQWAYEGKPLYRSISDVHPGDTNGIGSSSPDGDAEGRLATVDEAPDRILSPASVTVKSMPQAGGDVFVDGRGMTLYLYEGDSQHGRSACVGSCLSSWTPLKAAELAKPIGDWSIVHRDDGGRQWAYKGRPLYSFAGDRKPGQARGQYADPHWQPALVLRYFMPAEATLSLNRSGPALVAADGRTLYARDRYRFSNGGFSVNEGPQPTPAIGRSVGAAGCQSECEKSWTPLAAPTGAQASGFWSITIRDDGTRQWTYQGYPLYTNVHDKKPGDMTGRDMFAATDGSNAFYWRIALP